MRQKDRPDDSNRDNSKKLHSLKFKKDRVSWIVFVFTISVVSINLVSVIFPALISSSAGYSQILQELGLNQKINPFEPGPMTVHLFASCIIVFGLTLMYFKNKMPDFLSKIFVKLFKFEISRRIAIISIIIILGIYVIATAGELESEETWLDYPGVKNRLENWSIDQATNLSEPHVRYFFLNTSMTLFGNYAVIPFIASIALLLTTYFVTKEIAKKRFAGIVAMIVLIQSNIFLLYDTSVTYDNFWILFYLVSLYTVIKAWPISPLSYLISIPSKALTAVFLPMSLFFVYRAEIERKEKLILLGTYVIIGIIGIILISSFNATLSGTEFIESELSFWQGFSSMAFQLRFDGLVVLFLLPLVIGLFVASKHGYKYADSILVLIGVFLLTTPFLTGFTNMTNQPYRFVPLIVFFAMGVGVLLSKRFKEV